MNFSTQIGHKLFLLVELFQGCYILPILENLCPKDISLKRRNIIIYRKKLMSRAALNSYNFLFWGSIFYFLLEIGLLLYSQTTFDTHFSIILNSVQLHGHTSSNNPSNRKSLIFGGEIRIFL